MKQQAPAQIQKKTMALQTKGNLPHLAVRTLPDHDMPSNGSVETRFGHDFCKVTAQPSAPIVVQGYSNAQTSRVDGADTCSHIQLPCSEGKEEIKPKKEDELLTTKIVFNQTSEERNTTKSHRNRVRPNFVSCRTRGIWNPRITGADIVNAITNADTEAITLGRRAQNLIFLQRLTFGTNLYGADADFDNALTNRFGLNINNSDNRENTLPIIERRFERASDILESGSMHYTCRGVNCGPGDFAYTDPGVYRINLCNGFWNNPNDRPDTILHEALHIYFGSIGDTPECPTPDISNAWCYEFFARDIS